MAIKANASAQGSDFKKYVGVASFRVMGVNPTKEELEKFYGREIPSEPVYIKEKEDPNDDGKKYTQLRVSFMIQADDPTTISEITPTDKEAAKTNAALKEPLKTTVNFFIDSRYFYNRDKSKVQVLDKYSRSAWVTIEQAKNHQIPVYSNGPAKLDADYLPAFRGEEELTSFILNYLNVSPIDSYNKNTGTWMTNQHPEDCEAKLYKIKDYFKGDISELKELCSLMPTNRVKLLVGLRTDNEGKQFSTVYTRLSMRNGSKNYNRFKDSVEGNQNSDTVFTNDSIGIISNIQEYADNVTETDFSKLAAENDPFAQAAAIPEAGSDLPFEPTTSDDPFANM